MNPWRAGCGESRTSGSEGGPEKPTSRKTGRALRPDPYTQQRTGEGWLYLAVVLDAFSRRIVGWSMADHLRTELVLDALDMAITQRQPTPGLIHHTDHGCQPRFKGSSQHRLVGSRVAARSGPRRGSSNPGSCGVGC
jgi:putative transposase